MKILLLYYHHDYFSGYCLHNDLIQLLFKKDHLSKLYIILEEKNNLCALEVNKLLNIIPDKIELYLVEKAHDSIKFSDAFSFGEEEIWKKYFSKTVDLSNTIITSIIPFETSKTPMILTNF